MRNICEYCCPIWVQFLASSPDFVGILGANSFLSKTGLPPDPENTEREIYFSAYREIPIDENKLSNRIHDRGILHRPIPIDLGSARVFAHNSSACKGFRVEYFCLSVYPPAAGGHLPTNKNFSLCPRRLCLQPIGPHVLPVKVRLRELAVCPHSYI